MKSLLRELQRQFDDSKSSSDGGVTASPSKTDEELARELQRQFDEEGVDLENNNIDQFMIFFKSWLMA